MGSENRALAVPYLPIRSHQELVGSAMLRKGGCGEGGGRRWGVQAQTGAEWGLVVNTP